MKHINGRTTEAFWAGRETADGNTRVVLDGRWVVLLLHGSAIVRRKGTRVEISLAGYPTDGDD